MNQSSEYYVKYFLEITSAILGNRYLRTQVRNKEGALKLAREIGYGLKGADEKTLKDIVSRSYSTILVRATSLNPPVDAREWNQEMYRSARD